MVQWFRSWQACGLGCLGYLIGLPATRFSILTAGLAAAIVGAAPPTGTSRGCRDSRILRLDGRHGHA